HMIMPFFIIFLVIYLIYIKKADFKQIAVMGVPLFLLAVPLMLFHYINMFDLNAFNLGIFTIPKMYRYRSGDLSLDIVKENISYFFRTTLLYDTVPFNSIPKYGNMYFFSIPFVILGLGHDLYECVRACKKKIMSVYTVIILWAVCVYAMGLLLTDGGPTVYRVNSIFLAYLFFAVDGLLISCHIVKKYIHLRAKVFYEIVLTIYMGLFVSFIMYYFHDYTACKQMIDLFNFPFDDTLHFMQQELSEGVTGRITYIGDCDQTYIYYLGGTLTPPDEYNELLDDDPYTLWLWTQSYKNYRFYFPEEIDPLGNYIVPDTDEELIELYSQYGFRQEHVGRHYLFWNDMLEETQSKAKAVVDWGHGIKDGNVVMDNGEYTFLSGWALNTSYSAVWGDVIAIIDGKDYYVAEKMDRKDVSDVLHNDLFKRCGFRLKIPNEVLKNSESIRILFIDYKDRECYIETYNK
ncbi:MAG: hypothetical protein K2N90_05855, partial [Lachnospiraceae bacterium]|nr:hypothetical protein [Lachnospiraceae bacterium]